VTVGFRRTGICSTRVDAINNYLATDYYFTRQGVKSLRSLALRKL